MREVFINGLAVAVVVAVVYVLAKAGLLQKLALALFNLPG